MSESTVMMPVEFGEKANDYHTETGSFSTIGYIDEILLTHSFPYYNSGVYKTIDYSDQKKMDAYRKVNKMLGGK